MHSGILRAMSGLLVCLAGCSTQRIDLSDSDPERARSVLTTALDAWKAGQVESLASRTPSIRFQDDDLLAGFRLVSYELVEHKLPILPFRDVKIVLELRDPRGQAVTKAVRYQVGVEPALTVLRSDN